MSNRDCSPCSVEVNQYQDDWVDAFIDWLSQVSCIGWIQRNPDTSSPAEDECINQFGTVSVDSFEYHTPDKDGVVSRSENQACIRIKNLLKVSVVLTVYNSKKMPESSGQRLRTPADVLIRVFDTYYGLPRLAQVLHEQGLTIETHEQINSSEDEYNSTMRRLATVEIQLCVSRRTSFADDVMSGFSLAFGCDTDEEDDCP